jgi:hypothetical protein
VFRFIIEYYSSLMDFGGPLVIALFLYEDVFKDEIFGFCWKLEINSYRVII